MVILIKFLNSSPVTCPDESPRKIAIVSACHVVSLLPEGPSTQHVRFLVAKTMPLMGC